MKTIDEKQESTPPATPFAAHLEKRGIDYATAATELGITSSYVGMLARGRATPQLELAGKIHAWSDGLVPMWIWLTGRLREEVYTSSRRKLSTILAPTERAA